MTYRMWFFLFVFFKKGTFPFPLPPRLNIYSSNCSFGIFFIFFLWTIVWRCWRAPFVHTEEAFSTAMYNKRFIFPSSPVYLSPLQSTCAVLARFIKLLLQAFLFHYLVSENSPYMECLHMSPQICLHFTFWQHCLWIEPVVSIHLVQIILTCVSCDHLRTNPPDSNSVCK